MCICLSTQAVDVVDIDDIDESVQTSYGIGLIESINWAMCLFIRTAFTDLYILFDIS